MQGQQIAGRYVVFCLFQVGDRRRVMQDGERLESALGVVPVQLRMLLGQKEDAVDRRVLRQLRAWPGLQASLGLRETDGSRLFGIGHRPSVPPGHAAVALDVHARRHLRNCCSTGRALTALDR